MTAVAYDFDTQKQAGEESERRLDEYFERWYTIEPVSMERQRQGIDRIFTRRDNAVAYTIEYKTDWTAGKTGNAFVEAVSVDTQNKLGWAYTSKAEYLLYYVPGDLIIYVLEFTQLRLRLDLWKRKYREMSIPNRGYCTRGLLVPLAEFEKIAQQVISL